MSKLLLLLWKKNDGNLKNILWTHAKILAYANSMDPHHPRQNFDPLHPRHFFDPRRNFTDPRHQCHPRQSLTHATHEPTLFTRLLKTQARTVNTFYQKEV